MYLEPKCCVILPYVVMSIQFTHFSLHHHLYSSALVFTQRSSCAGLSLFFSLVFIRGPSCAGLRALLGSSFCGQNQAHISHSINSIKCCFHILCTYSFKSPCGSIPQFCFATSLTYYKGNLFVNMMRTEKIVFYLPTFILIVHYVKQHIKWNK